MKRFYIHILLTLCLLLPFMGCGSRSAEKAVQRGLHAFDAGDYARARTSIERGIRDRTDLREDAPIYNVLGMACAHLNDLPAATNAYMKSQQLDPKGFAAYYNLGVALCEQGQVSEGARMLMRAASNNAEDTRALEYLASVYQNHGMSQQARSILLAAQQRDPESARILTLLAVTGLEGEGAVYASSYLTEAIRKDDAYGPARFNLGVLHDLWLKDREGAIGHYRQFLKDGAQGDQSTQAESAIARLEQAIAKEFNDQAAATPTVDVYTPDEPPQPPLGAPKPPPPSPPAEVDSVEGLLAYARKEVEEGNSSNALNLCLQAAAMASRDNDVALEEKSLRTAVALCKDLPRAHYAMGRYLNERGEYRQAMQAFQAAAEIEPNWAQAHLSAAAAGRACSEFQAALRALRKAVEVAPDNPDALWSLGIFYDDQLKLPESAQRTFEQFVTRFEDDPRVPDARERLGRLKLPTSPTKPVVVAADKPRTLHHQVVNVDKPTAQDEPPTEEDLPIRVQPPKTPTETPTAAKVDKATAIRLFNEGAKFQSQGNYDQAVLHYQNALKSDPGYAPVYYNLGLIYQQRKQLESARNAYMKAAEHDDQLVNAHFNLALICRELGDEARAHSELDIVLKQRPNHALSHFVLGQIYAGRSGRTVDARRHFNRFLELAPNDPVAPEARRWLLQH